jgi:hypothetical protein
VSASSATDAWAVGRTQINKSSFEGLALHWNGTAWSVSPGLSAALSMIGGASAVGVADISPGDAYAIGDSGVTDVPDSQKTLIEHFNGTTWRIAASPSPGSIDVLSGVTTSNASDNVWAVGADTPAGTSVRHTLTLNWNGTAWKVVGSPNAGSTDGVGAVATNPGAAIVWAVGESGPPGSFNPLVLRHG